MKYLAVALLLAACAKSQDPPTFSAVPAAQGRAEAESLAHSETLSEHDAISAAAKVAASGFSMPASTAQRCWEREAFRPNVREACLLAWAGNGEDSERLNEVLRSSFQLGPFTRAKWLAAARRDRFVQKLGVDELLRLLAALSDEPAWLRGLVAIEWSMANSPDFPQRAAVYSEATTTNIDADPLAVGASLVLAHRFGLPASVQPALDRACAKGVSGPAITRCLRLLSAAADPRLSGFPYTLKTLLPPESDPGSLLYKRSFPTRPTLY